MDYSWKEISIKIDKPERFFIFFTKMVNLDKESEDFRILITSTKFRVE